MKQPTLKQTTMAFAIILAMVLFTFDLINWRDAMLISVLPIALYHLLYLYILKNSTPVKVVPITGMRTKEEVKNIESLFWCKLISHEEAVQLKYLQFSVEELKELAAREFANELAPYIECIEQRTYQGWRYTCELKILRP